MSIRINVEGHYPNTIEFQKSGNFIKNGQRVSKINWNLAPELLEVGNPVTIPSQSDISTFVDSGFNAEESVPVTEDLHERFHVLAAFGGGKSGAHVYKVIGKPHGAERPGIYILKLYHERPSALWGANREAISRLVFSLTPGDGPNYDAAMTILNKVGGLQVHALLDRAVQRMQAEGTANTGGANDVIATIRRNFKSGEIKVLTALAEAAIHFFRALKDVEVGLTLQSAPEKVCPYIYEYGFVRGDPFAVEGGYVTIGDITCYAVSEYVQGYDFADFIQLLTPPSNPECAPTECKVSTRRRTMNVDFECGQSPCAIPANLRSYIATSLLFRIAHLMTIFEEHFRTVNGQPVGCHRDLHPGNIKILLNPDTSREGWLNYWTQTEILEDGYKIIGPQILLIDFDLSISVNPLINRSYYCQRRNPILGALGLQNLIAASAKFLFKHLAVRVKKEQIQNWTEKQQNLKGKLGNFIFALLFDSGKSLRPGSIFWTKLNQTGGVGDADLFAWKVLVVALLDYIAVCKTFRECMNTGPFATLRLVDQPIEAINDAIENYKVRTPDEHTGYFRLNTRSKGGSRTLRKTRRLRRRL